MDWIDISMPLRSGGPGWPGDAPVEVARSATIGRGSPYNMTKMALSAHSGTHVDAPLHYIPGGRSIDAIDFDAVVGPARVVGISDTESIKPAELEGLDVRPGERLLFRTANSDRPWPDLPFREDYVFLTPEAAGYLVSRGVRCVGVDYLSVGPPDVERAASTHIRLLEGGVWIIECLYLAEVTAGDYDLICLPLRVEGAEGAPARALLRPRQ